MNVKQSHLGWSYSLNQEEFHGVYETKEEAIEEALDVIECDGDEQDVFWIAEALEPIISVNASQVLEYLRDESLSEYGEYVDDYLLDVNRVDEDELTDMLTKVFKNWSDKNGYKPNFYGIGKEESFSINDYDSEKREIKKQHKQTDIFQMG
jgi:hypothetical protein